ncbi:MULTISPECIES: hypothetical protein [unclassified Ruminococcus]|uniref:hypothetical protein n=1 Tax=unclassified Ruminococcus TaxID=2608920 RepID=UPI00210AA06E|nr:MULTISPECIES: hypothetical protein [unclassified Ruminococcus]MCQ4021441.1 hypothetical protein [Ruminococcus sp. zg-924]MCQ4113886.1 hypothetical protein [Ruminococcus sp. zg-921]
MNIFESIGSCLSDAVQTVVEKNRIKAQVNRLRLVMRSEAKTINKAYIELGKEYYRKIKDNELAASDEAKEHCQSIVNSSKRFKRAIARYHELIDSQVIAESELTSDDEEDESGDITLCCSYEEASTSDEAPNDKLDAQPSQPLDDEADSEFKADDIQSVKDKLDEMTDSTSKASEEE